MYSRWKQEHECSDPNGWLVREARWVDMPTFHRRRPANHQSITRWGDRERGGFHCQFCRNAAIFRSRPWGERLSCLCKINPLLTDTVRCCWPHCVKSHTVSKIFWGVLLDCASILMYHQQMATVCSWPHPTQIFEIMKYKKTPVYI